jgi:2'-5' RNA ligase
MKGTWTTLLLIVVTGSAHAEDKLSAPSAAKADGKRVVAIDVLLEPDATMTKKAVVANARLRENYPEGYTLGPEHVSHITLVHAYVHEKDLPQLEATVAKLADAAQPLKWELTATGYTHAIWSGVAITTIGVERTRALDAFQERIAKAAERVAVAGGTATAFSTTRELPKIDKEIIAYVKNFMANSSGTKYNPHVTIGVAHEDFVKQLSAEPFKKFKFKPAGVAIYQLGNFGTAQKNLWEWKRDEETRKRK